MEPKKKILQCPICQATYSRKDNLLRHLKKFHSENIAARMPTKMVKNSKPCLSESVVFNTPFTMIVSGATMSGKTEWVKRLLTQRTHDDPCTKESFISLQGLATILYRNAKDNPEITFHQGMPNDLVQLKFFDPDVPSLIVFDDLMRTVLSDETAADLFSEGAHHHNISIVFIMQSLFFQGKQSRTISLNADYFILLKNPRDRQQVEAFGRQTYPRKSNTYSEAYEIPTMRPHGYLVVDLYPTTPDSCRLRMNIFSGENNQFHPNDIFHTISAIAESFKKKNYMESAELQAMHNRKKQMDTLIGRDNLPSEIKAQETGKAQDR